MSEPILDEQLERRRRASSENRIPPAIAVLVAVAAYALLPEYLLIAPRFVIPAIELVLLVALVVTNPSRMSRQTRLSRIASAFLIVIVIVANLIALVRLVIAISDQPPPGGSLLIAGIQVWLTNVVGFALLYWELDRGGPVARRRLARSSLPPADWRFSQDENADTVVEVAAGSSRRSGWIPIFVDYLYLSLTNSSAFSPTDTMPLTPRAKLLMGTQATVALFVSLVIVARAVGALGGS